MLYIKIEGTKMYELDFKLHKDLLDKCLRGEVCLFTGSGFSIGAKIKGDKIFSTDNLINAILEELLKIEDEEQIIRIKRSKDFQKICQYAITMCTEDSFNEFLTNKFKDVTPQAFHNSYNQIDWKDIFTTNIDDLLEAVYKPVTKRLQVMNTAKQTSHYVGEDSVKYYKLHGDVNNKSQGFIFSNAQYMRSIADNTFHHPTLQFTEQLYKDTFCFIGSNFNEIDIERYIHQYQKQFSFNLPKNKIYYISKNIYPEDVAELATRHIIPIQETAETFITKLLEYKKTIESQKPKSKLTITNKVDVQLRLEKMGFSAINKNIFKFDKETIKKHKPINFYEGYSPSWIDIVSDSDAVLDSTKKIISSIEENENEFQLITMVGKSGNGKTTALKRILYDFSCNSDYLVSEHLNNNEINNTIIKDLIRLINNETKKIIFGFDNGSWSFKFIESLYSKIDSNKKVTFIITSRYPEFYRERTYISGIKKELIYFDDNLGKSNAGLIINTLDKKGHLGSLAAYKTHDERIQALLKIQTSNKDLFSCLIKATQGEGFFERIHSHIDTALKTNNINVKLLFLLAILDKFGSLALSKSIFYNVFKNEIENFTTLQESLSNIIDSNSNNQEYIRLRGEYITDYILQNIQRKKYLNNNDIFDTTANVLMYTTSVYDIDKRKKRSYITELSSLLLNSRHYINYLNIRNKQYYDDFYNTLKDYYKELAPFWLYYAKMEMKLKDLKSAWVHLEYAKALSDSYDIEHTIGQWHLVKARQIANYDLAIIEFEKGEIIMQTQIKLRSDSYPIHTYIEEFIYFYKDHKDKINNNKFRILVDLIYDAKEQFPDQVIVLIIWKKFYNFLKDINLSKMMSLKYEDAQLMHKIDLNKSAEEQYHLLNL
jgi:hypothetical protein